MDDLTQLSLEQLGQIPVVPGQKRSWFTPAPQQQLPEPIAKALAGDPRLALAQQLMGQNDFKPVRTPLEGLAKMAAALSGAYIQRQTRDSYKGDADTYRKQLATGLQALAAGDTEGAMKAFSESEYLQDPAMQIGLMGYKGKIESQQEAAKSEAQIKREEIRQAAQDARAAAAEAGRDSRLGQQLTAQADMLDRRLAASDAALDRRLAAQRGRDADGGYRLMTPDEVKAAGLPPGSYQVSGKNEIKPIAGSVKSAAASQKAINAATSAMEKANIVTAAVDEALDKVGVMSAGIIGQATRGVGGTPAFNLEQAIAPIKANLGFKELQDMRSASPTGGALGQVAVKELEFLQASVASLDTAQTPEQLKRNLQKVKTHYDNWKNIMLKASEQPDAVAYEPAGGSVVKWGRDAQGRPVRLP